MGGMMAAMQCTRCGGRWRRGSKAEMTPAKEKAWAPRRLEEETLEGAFGMPSPTFKMIPRNFPREPRGTSDNLKGRHQVAEAAPSPPDRKRKRGKTADPMERDQAGGRRSGGEF